MCEYLTIGNKGAKVINGKPISLFRDELLRMAGGEEEYKLGQACLVEIPVEELPNYFTACGMVGSKPFSKEIIDFLTARKIPGIYACLIVYGVSLELTSMRITSASIPISREDAEILSEMISEQGGSLRADVSRIAGWSCFESE